jgi:hypothetical protein
MPGTQNRFQVRALDLAAEDQPLYDALIATLGFEQRATAVASRLAGRTGAVWAYSYPSNHVHSFDNNQKYFIPYGIIDEPESALRKRIASSIGELRTALTAIHPDRKPHVAVDISCMDRDRIARTLLALTTDQDEAITIDFYYNIAEFSDDLVGSEGTVLVNRPVDGLEGWSTNLDGPLICLMGLGFENRLALAAIETLEPAETIVLLPEGDDPRYDEVVRYRNRSLLGEDGAADQYGVVQRRYDVTNAYQTVVDLDTTVAAMVREGRVVLVPIGPKIFALACILVGIAQSTNVTVWRLSADEDRSPEDRTASDTFVGLRLIVRPVQP